VKLAIFSYGLPVAGEKRGGIERAAHTLAQGLAERGHHIVVFSHDHKPRDAAYEVRELPWKSFVNTWLGRRVTMGYLGNVMAALPDYRGFEAVISYGDSLLLPLRNKPVLRVMLGSALGEAKSAKSIGRLVLQSGIYLQELASALIENSVGISENTRRDNPFVRSVISLGVDQRVFRQTAEAKTDEPSIIFVGTALGRKRGNLLLEIFQQVVRASHPGASLMFVGPQGDPAPGVTYYTGISDEQLASLYRRAWIYASPSTYEGFGLPYLEAMACGTAVVATPNPGSLEVLQDGKYGLLADDAGFGGVVLDLLANQQRRKQMETMGLRRAHLLSLDAMLDQYETLLEKLCSAHGRSIVSA
jgi:glycosyltransferase involved in cell wall biosynthesis